MVQKRPFEDEETFEVSTKHPRQVRHSDQLFSPSESVFSECVPQEPHTPGEAGFVQNNTEGDEKLSSDVITEHQASGEDVASSGPGCISISSGPSSGACKEDSQPQTPVYVPVSSEYFFPERSAWAVDHPGDLYSLLLDYPPRKPVPVGQNHQADIPTWGSQYNEETSKQIGKSEVVLGSEHIALDADERVRMGTCVISMPDLGSAAYYGKVGNGRSDCCCEDWSSVRCVRQHIIEAREQLRKHLGQEKFVELGFLDMGEVVADKWSAGEEQMFHKIVYCNPASLGKNFWDILTAVFPSRTKKEIISYYFNVFMLRKRAEQNRCYPLNISSDNDEWQGSDDYGDNETSMSEDDEDSVVESPVYNADLAYSREKDLRIYEEDADDRTCYNNETTDFVCEGSVTNNSEAYPGKLMDGCGSNLSSQLQDNILGDEKGDREIQDDSCTSSDTGASSQGVKVKADKEGRWPGSFNEMSKYVVEPCDAKVWDAGYASCHQNKVELLPTCSMIEEVFGDGSWNYKVRDGKA